MKPAGTKKRQYSVNAMQKALKYVLSKKGSIREAARRFGVPRSSIQFKVTHPNTKCTSGPSTVLTEDEESALANLTMSLDKRGFPRKKAYIQISAQKILEEKPRKNPFRNNCPNTGWYTAFLKRHPEISTPIISTAPAEDDLITWYNCIRQYISENNLYCVLTDPKRLFKADETNFKVCPNTAKVFTDLLFQKAQLKLSVFFSFSATGVASYPMLIYPDNIPEKTSETIPDGWGFISTTKGKITADSFYHYIRYVLHPDLVQKKINFPVILFVDRNTPVTLNVSKLCIDLDIHLIGMYPNGSHIQALVFQSLKASWRKGLRTSYQTPLTTFSFASLFKNIFNDFTNKDILIDAFHKLGLFPFDEDNIDCSKGASVLKETIEIIEDDSEDENEHSSEDVNKETLLDDNIPETDEDLENENKGNTLSEEIMQDSEEQNKVKDVESSELIDSEYLDCKIDILELPICDICLDNITETALECCRCFNTYHTKCIRNFHKNPSPKEYLCHICN